MAKTFTNVKDIFDKQNNAEVEEQITSEIESGATGSDEVLTAEEWQQVGTAITELQTAVNDVDNKAVKKIVRNGVELPFDNGTVTMPSDDTTVTVLCEGNLSTVVSVDGTLNVNLAFTSVANGAAKYETVDVKVQTFRNGEYTTVGTFTAATSNYANPTYKTYNLVDYGLGSGVFSNLLIEATGRTTMMSGSYQFDSVTATTMKLVNDQNYQSPIIATQQAGSFPVSYTVYGTVTKTLHLALKNGTDRATYDYELTASDDNKNITKALSDNNLLKHGVTEVVAWLTCDNGNGTTLYSDILINRFMVVNTTTEGADLTKPYILLQQICSDNTVSILNSYKNNVTNFVQTSLCDYSLFSPVVTIDDSGTHVTNTGDSKNIVFILSNYASEYEGWTDEYLRIENVVSPGQTEELLTTIEIEDKDGAEASSYFNSYLWVRLVDDDVDTDILNDSTGVSNISIYVDNTQGFSPVSGADFLLNPKVRNNTESNPERIFNARNNNSLVQSQWSGFGFINDGWITSDMDNQKVLRVPAGAKLKIAYNPFSQFLDNPNSSMTFDIDFAIHNIIDEDSAILAISEIIESTGSTLGFVMKPYRGDMYNAANMNDNDSPQTSFFYGEDIRTHISVNIHNSIHPKGTDYLCPTSTDSKLDISATSIALVRIFVNGIINREMKFSVTNVSEFGTQNVTVDAEGNINHGIEIGSDGADIDIYSLRCYKNKNISSEQVQQNYMSTLPTSAEKLKFSQENQITTGGLVDIEKCKDKGKRCLIWHGTEPYKFDVDAKKGYWEIFQYNADGTLNKDLSGTICKDTGALEATRQGSTANTYYYSNLQTKIKDVADDDDNFLWFKLSAIHSSIVIGDPYAETKDGVETGKTVVDVYGGNLGKQFPVKNKAKAYEYKEESGDGYVLLPDGWIDGNGLYRGLGYKVAENVPLAQKLVLKINYASSMQTHLNGCTRLYNDLHTKIVGKNSLQSATFADGTTNYSKVAKYNEPVFFFTQSADGGDIIFRGGGNFGAGKMDKPTWGYDKSVYPKFCMLEGSDNDQPLTDFRVPFDLTHIIEHVDNTDPTEPEVDGWTYAGTMNLDIDAMKMDTDGDGITRPSVDKDGIAVTSRIMDIWNFIYLHSPMISYYSGTFADFVQSTEASANITKKYWCTQGDDAFKLKRYDFINSTWVDAGLWNDETQKYEEINLQSYSITTAAYTNSTNKEKFNLLNQEFIDAFVADCKANIDDYFNTSSLKFHYCFINHFMCGTDNCSKNTYFVLDPETLKIEMHQDDVDTIMGTDNNGQNTKPYFIDRMHPIDPANPTLHHYEGEDNALFNLCELMWENTLELQSMMAAILSSMSSLVNSTDDILGYTGSAKVSVWGCLYKYFFQIQNYYPAVAYNEQARIRYEMPEMLGYVSSGSGARGVAPITQSLGDQLQAEMSWMKRRVVYMASYAAWGPFNDGKSGETGISDLALTFSIQAATNPDGTASDYVFDLVPQQYLYPTGMTGQSVVDYHVRVAPGETYNFVLKKNNTSNGTNSDGETINAIHYYRSIGNIGNISTYNGKAIEVTGNRLTKFEAAPTKFYTDATTGESVPAFRPSSISIRSTRLSEINLNGCSQVGGTIDCSKLTRLEKIDIRNTNISGVSYPSSTFLKDVYLGNKVISVSLKNMPSLENFNMDSYANVTSMIVDASTLGSIDTLIIAQNLYSANPSKLSKVQFTGVNWGTGENIPLPAMVYWLCQKNATLSGKIDSSKATTTYNFNQKVDLAKLYGNVDDSENEIYLIYKIINISSVSISGDKFVYADLCTLNSDNTTYTYSGYSLVAFPSNGNNIAIKDNKVDMTWSLASNSYASISNDNTGEIKISSFSDQDITFTLSVVAKTTSNTELSASHKIGFYRRIPKLGDFAYLDGTFDEEYDTTKDLAGIVFARLWYQYNPNEDLPEGVKSNPILTYESVNGQYVIDTKAKYMKLFIVSKEYMSQKTSDGLATPISSGMSWGLYPDSGGTNGFTSDEMSTILAYINEKTGKNYSSMFDLSDLTNITTNGVVNKDGTNGQRAYADNIQADMTSEDDYLYGGFRPANTPQVASGNITTSQWNGKENTKKIKNWVDTIIQTYISDKYSVTNPPTTLQELADYMYNMLYNTVGDGTKSKYYQFAYPAAYACTLYEPTQNKSVIDEQYKSGNWYLAGIGELIRLYHHFNISRFNPMTTTNTGDNSNTPSATCATYDSDQGHEGLDAWNPIFAKAYQRIADAGEASSVFKNLSASAHWSSTEANSGYAWYVGFYGSNVGTGNGKYGGYSVRPVAAYLFEL